MLKVWVNPPGDDGIFVGDVDLSSMVFLEDVVMQYDITKRILEELYPADCLSDSERERTDRSKYLLNCGAIPEGVKMLLLMLSPDKEEREHRFDYAICGKNCDKFLEEIADMRDVEIALGRVYVPFSSGRPKSGVKFMESGTVVYDAESFIKEYKRLGGVD